MAAVHQWATAKAPRRKSKSFKRTSEHSQCSSLSRHSDKGAWLSAMRKPKNSNEGKDRLKALAAAAARAAGANLTTYFADDDGRGSLSSGKRPVRHFDSRHLLEYHLASPTPAAGPRFFVRSDVDFEIENQGPSAVCEGLRTGSATLKGRQLPGRLRSPEGPSRSGVKGNCLREACYAFIAYCDIYLSWSAQMRSSPGLLERWGFGSFRLRWTLSRQAHRMLILPYD